MLRTVTFDDTQFKLLPVTPTDQMLLDLALRHHWYSQFFCPDREKAISGCRRLLERSPAVPADLTLPEGPTLNDWVANARVLLDSCPETLRSRQGGGPEVLFESLVLTFSRLQALVAAAADSQACGTHEVGLQAE